MRVLIFALTVQYNSHANKVFISLPIIQSKYIHILLAIRSHCFLFGVKF